MCEAAICADAGRGVGSAIWGWGLTATFLILLHLYGPFDRQDAILWKTVANSYVCFEAVRLVSVSALPIWWHARRGTYPSAFIRETFGTQVLSLAVSLYTLFNLWTLQLYWSKALPFLHPVEDGRNIEGLHHMTAMLGTYVVVDTSHLIRAWRYAPNRAMLLHHAIFSIVLGIGAAWPQLPPHYRIHVILFTAELSTPLLNIRWILRFVAQRRVPVSLLVGFLVLFLASRIGLYGALIADLARVRRKLSFPPLIQDIFCSAVFASYLLNLYWLSIIVKQAVGGPKKGAASDNTSEKKRT